MKSRARDNVIVGGVLFTLLILSLVFIALYEGGSAHRSRVHQWNLMEQFYYEFYVESREDLDITEADLLAGETFKAQNLERQGEFRETLSNGSFRFSSKGAAGDQDVCMIWTGGRRTQVCLGSGGVLGLATKNLEGDAEKFSINSASLSLLEGWVGSRAHDSR